MSFMHGQDFSQPVTHNVMENGKIVSFTAVPVATLSEMRDLGNAIADPNTMNKLVDEALDRSGLPQDQIDKARRAAKTKPV